MTIKVVQNVYFMQNSGGWHGKWFRTMFIIVMYERGYRRDLQGTHVTTISFTDKTNPSNCCAPGQYQYHL